MQSFLDVTFPPFLALAFCAFLALLAARLAGARMRLWSAQRRRVDGTSEALTAAADALAAAIADPGLGDSARDQAETAYAAVSTAITKENDHQ